MKMIYFSKISKKTRMITRKCTRNCYTSFVSLLIVQRHHLK